LSSQLSSESHGHGFFHDQCAFFPSSFANTDQVVFFHNPANKHTN